MANALVILAPAVEVGRLIDASQRRPRQAAFVPGGVTGTGARGS
jgi:hypothetical protein